MFSDGFFYSNQISLQNAMLSRAIASLSVINNNTRFADAAGHINDGGLDNSMVTIQSLRCTLEYV